MNPIITEQIEKFKTGDFSGYESFYNETVNTVYTMLQTIVNDQNVATSLVPQVYDKIYKNTETLEQTEGFYQWAAKFANAEALGYLQENHLTGTISSAPEYEGKAPTADLQSGSEQAEITEQFYDYAAEDAALTITETEVADASFVTKLQEIVQTLSPIERVVFQEYYYFGVGVPEIAAKTGCKDADIRYTLSRTRTSILQAITESATATGNIQNPDVQNADERRYHLSEAPWLWIAYQNYLGYTLGIDTASIAGWSLGILGQAAGMAGVEGAVAGTGGAAGAGAAAGGASGIGGVAAAVIGSIGGKIALGVIGAALVTSIGFGVHHVVANQDREGARQDKAPTVTEVIETTEEMEATTETEAPTTEATTEITHAAEDEETGIGASKIDYNKAARSAYKDLLLSAVKNGTVPYKDGGTLDIIENQSGGSETSHDTFAIADVDCDGVEELLFYRTNACMAGMVLVIYSYDKEAGSVYIKDIASPFNPKFYDSGYVTLDASHNQIPASFLWPYTICKFENGSLKSKYSCWNWDSIVFPETTGYNGESFPAEYDLDGDGVVYYIADDNSTRIVDEAEYDAFIQSLNMGNEIPVDEKELNTQNINTL